MYVCRWHLQVALPVPPPPRCCEALAAARSQYGFQPWQSTVHRVREASGVFRCDLRVWQVPPGSQLPCVAETAAWGHHCVLAAWEGGQGADLEEVWPTCLFPHVSSGTKGGTGSSRPGWLWGVGLLYKSVLTHVLLCPGLMHGPLWDKSP